MEYIVIVLEHTWSIERTVIKYTWSLDYIVLEYTLSIYGVKYTDNIVIEYIWSRVN